MSKEKEVSNKSTKNELWDAYNELIEKTKTQNQPNFKEQKEKDKQKEIVQEASGLSNEKILKNISGLKLEVVSSLDKLEDTLVSEFKKLEQLQQAIKIEQKNLEETYQIKVNADSLMTLLIAQKEKKQSFDEEMTNQKEEWNKEQKEFETQQLENKTKTQKDRKREEEEYNYTLQLTRKKDQDQYTEKKTNLEKELEQKRTRVETELKERETIIAAKEKEFETLKAQVDNFNAELEAKLKTKETEVTEKLEFKYKFEVELKSKETQGEQKLFEQTIASLKAKIKEQETYLEQVTSKANEANLQVKEIAFKAVEGASHVRFFEKSVETTKN